MANEVTESTLHSNSFKSIYTFIDTYKLTGTTVYSGFPNKQGSFPCYVINPVEIISNDRTIGHQHEQAISVEIEMWCVANDKKEKIDAMRDALYTMFITYITTFEAQNITLADDWYDDTNINTVDRNDVKYHTGNVMLRFILK